MNHKNRVNRIKDINHLQEPAALTPAPDQKFVFADLLREWPLCVPDNHFRLVAIYAVLGKVIPVPFNPSK
jgi:hypothetical protein